MTNPKRGDRVLTPGGEGVVAWTRNGPPTYSSPEAVSVVLDGKRMTPGYVGTVYAVEKVEVLPALVD